MSEQLMTNSTRIGVLERPLADFTLRRTLEMVGGPREAAAAMSVFSRFVVLVPVPQCPYVRCATLDEVFHVIELARDTLSRKGYRHFYVGRSVSPDVQRLIDEGVERLELAVRPPAANDPN